MSVRCCNSRGTSSDWHVFSGLFLPVISCIRTSPFSRRKPLYTSTGKSFPSSCTQLLIEELVQRSVQRAVPNTGESQLQPSFASEVTEPLAQSALHRSREDQRSTTGSSGKVPDTPQVPTSANHLGRRGDILLFQGKVSKYTA